MAIEHGRFSQILSQVNITDSIEAIVFDSAAVYAIGWEEGYKDGSFFTWTHDLKAFRASGEMSCGK